MVKIPAVFMLIINSLLWTSVFSFFIHLPSVSDTTSDQRYTYPRISDVFSSNVIIPYFITRVSVHPSYYISKIRFYPHSEIKTWPQFLIKAPYESGISSMVQNLNHQTKTDESSFSEYTYDALSLPVDSNTLESPYLENDFNIVSEQYTKKLNKTNALNETEGPTRFTIFSDSKFFIQKMVNPVTQTNPTSISSYKIHSGAVSISSIQQINHVNKIHKESDGSLLLSNVQSIKTHNFNLSSVRDDITDPISDTLYDDSFEMDERQEMFTTKVEILNGFKRKPFDSANDTLSSVSSNDADEIRKNKIEEINLNMLWKEYSTLRSTAYESLKNMDQYNMLMNNVKSTSPETPFNNEYKSASENKITEVEENVQEESYTASVPKSDILTKLDMSINWNKKQYLIHDVSSETTESIISLWDQTQSSESSTTNIGIRNYKNKSDVWKETETESLLNHSEVSSRLKSNKGEFRKTEGASSDNKTSFYEALFKNSTLYENVTNSNFDMDWGAQELELPEHWFTIYSSILPSTTEKQIVSENYETKSTVYPQSVQTKIEAYEQAVSSNPCDEMHYSIFTTTYESIVEDRTDNYEGITSDKLFSDIYHISRHTEDNINQKKNKMKWYSSNEDISAPLFPAIEHETLQERHSKSKLYVTDSSALFSVQKDESASETISIYSTDRSELSIFPTLLTTEAIYETESIPLSYESHYLNTDISYNDYNILNYIEKTSEALPADITYQTTTESKSLLLLNKIIQYTSSDRDLVSTSENESHEKTISENSAQTFSKPNTSNHISFPTEQSVYTSDVTFSPFVFITTPSEHPGKLKAVFTSHVPYLRFYPNIQKYTNVENGTISINKMSPNEDTETGILLNEKNETQIYVEDRTTLSTLSVFSEYDSDLGMSLEKQEKSEYLTSVSPMENNPFPSKSTDPAFRAELADISLFLSAEVSPVTELLPTSNEEYLQFLFTHMNQEYVNISDISLHEESSSSLPIFNNYESNSNVGTETMWEKELSENEESITYFLSNTNYERENKTIFSNEQFKPKLSAVVSVTDHVTNDKKRNSTTSRETEFLISPALVSNTSEKFYVATESISVPRSKTSSLFKSTKFDYFEDGDQSSPSKEVDFDDVATETTTESTAVIDENVTKVSYAFIDYGIDKESTSKLYQTKFPTSIISTDYDFDTLEKMTHVSEKVESPIFVSLATHTPTYETSAFSSKTRNYSTKKPGMAFGVNEVSNVEALSSFDNYMSQEDKYEDVQKETDSLTAITNSAPKPNLVVSRNKEFILESKKFEPVFSFTVYESTVEPTVVFSQTEMQSDSLYDTTLYHKYNDEQKLQNTWILTDSSPRPTNIYYDNVNEEKTEYNWNISISLGLPIASKNIYDTDSYISSTEIPFRFTYGSLNVEERNYVTTDGKSTLQVSLENENSVVIEKTESSFSTLNFRNPEFSHPQSDNKISTEDQSTHSNYRPALDNIHNHFFLSNVVPEGKDYSSYLPFNGDDSLITSTDGYSALQSGSKNAATTFIFQPFTDKSEKVDNTLPIYSVYNTEMDYLEYLIPDTEELNVDNYVIEDDNQALFIPPGHSHAAGSANKISSEDKEKPVEVVLTNNSLSSLDSLKVYHKIPSASFEKDEVLDTQSSSYLPKVGRVSRNVPASHDTEYYENEYSYSDDNYYYNYDEENDGASIRELFSVAAKHLEMKHQSNETTV